MEAQNAVELESDVHVYDVNENKKQMTKMHNLEKCFTSIFQSLSHKGKGGMANILEKLKDRSENKPIEFDPTLTTHSILDVMLHKADEIEHEMRDLFKMFMMIRNQVNKEHLEQVCSSKAAFVEAYTKEVNKHSKVKKPPRPPASAASSDSASASSKGSSQSGASATIPPKPQSYDHWHNEYSEDGHRTAGRAELAGKDAHIAELQALSEQMEHGLYAIEEQINGVEQTQAETEFAKADRLDAAEAQLKRIQDIQLATQIAQRQAQQISAMDQYTVKQQAAADLQNAAILYRDQNAELKNAQYHIQELQQNNNQLKAQNDYLRAAAEPTPRPFAPLQHTPPTIPEYEYGRRLMDPDIFGSPTLSPAPSVVAATHSPAASAIYTPQIKEVQEKLEQAKRRSAAQQRQVELIKMRRSRSRSQQPRAAPTPGSSVLPITRESSAASGGTNVYEFQPTNSTEVQPNSIEDYVAADRRQALQPSLEPVEHSVSPRQTIGDGQGTTRYVEPQAAGAPGRFVI